MKKGIDIVKEIDIILNCHRITASVISLEIKKVKKIEKKC